MRSSSLATSSFVLLTLVMTWPLTAGLASDVPGDLGDSLLNMWILAWGAENLPRLATGEISVREFWNANMFHPEPLALAFSEHLFGQVLQILPVYHLTGNVLLAYNLLYLSTFVLSGLGMFLLVRDVLGHTGFSWPALVAGAIYAFLPMRIAQVAHIQSVSSQWMPFALYGFRRFLAGQSPGAGISGSRGPLNYVALAGGTLALLMQNWSNGYYLLYFAPFVVIFLLHQITIFDRVREWRAWTSLAGAAAVVIAGTLPFLMLYREGQRLHGIERPLGEVIRFSADVYSYLSAPEALRVWGRVVQAYPKPEGELFPGAVAILLVATVAFTAIRSASSSAAESPSPARTWMARLLLLIAGIQTAALIAILFTGGFITSFAGLPVRATNPARIATGIALVLAVLLAVSPAARSAARGAARSTVALSLVLGLLALWLSLGPMPQSAGRPLPGIAGYGVLYDHVPGFSGLRVPARYAMVASVFLSIVAGAGASALLGRFRWRTAGALLAAAAIGDVWFAPMPLNQTWGDSTPTPPAHIEPAAQAPAIYRSIASMDDAQVIVEFPFGDPAWELRYVYYSAVHWKRLINGYSGAFPPGYKVRVARLQRVNDNPDAAWATIIDAGATHAIVHSGALPPEQSEYLRNWLTVRGAVAVEESGGDWLFALPPR